MTQSGSGISLGAGPLYLLYLILPGLAFIKSMVVSYRSPDTLSRYDRLGYALAGSVVSGLALLGFLKLCAPGVESVKPAEFSSISTFLILSGVMAQSILASMFGIIFGGIRRISADSDRNFNDRQQPWDYTSDEIREEEVIIRTKSGEECQGIVARYGQGNEVGDLVVSPIDPNSRTELEVGDSNETDGLYVRQDAVSEVYFVDEEQEDEYGEVVSGGDIEAEDVEDLEGSSDNLG